MPCELPTLREIMFLSCIFHNCAPRTCHTTIVPLTSKPRNTLLVHKDGIPRLLLKIGFVQKVFLVEIIKTAQRTRVLRHRPLQLLHLPELTN